MIELRPISVDNIELLAEKYNMSVEDANNLIARSDSELYENKYFKMLVVLNWASCVGIVSLYEHSASVISIGPDIFVEYRKRGYGTEAMKLAMDIAREEGFTIVCQQIRTNNNASIKLHESLGFETDNYIFKNRNDNEVSIYLKSLL